MFGSGWVFFEKGGKEKGTKMGVSKLMGLKDIMMGLYLDSRDIRLLLWSFAILEIEILRKNVRLIKIHIFGDKESDNN